MNHSHAHRLSKSPSRASANRFILSGNEKLPAEGIPDHRLEAVTQRRFQASIRAPEYDQKMRRQTSTEAPQPVSLPVSSGVAQLGKRTKKDKEKILEKLRASFKRNKNRKAKPRLPRYIFNRQREGNYGYQFAEIARMVASSSNSDTTLAVYNPQQNPNINPSYTQLGFSDVSGYYRMGFGKQPFLYLNSESYDDKMIKSNYDDIIENFSGNDMEVAVQILDMISNGDEGGKDKTGQAKSLFVLLTQFIEAHDSRIPGSDKLARALLRRIAMGQLTFKEAFNRKDGLFVSAWAKGAKAKTGGQKAGRALFGEERTRDKFSFDDLEKALGEKMDDLYDTVEGYYSDESDEEGDFEGDEPMSSKETEINKDSVDKINEALKTLGLVQQLSDLRSIPALVLIKNEIRKNYKKLVVLHHPDKGGDKETFEKVNQAESYLIEIIDLFKSKGFSGLRESALNNLLSQNQLRMQQVAGNGNCFYAAVIDQIFYLDNFQVGSDVLRGRVAQLILDNAATLQVYATGNQLNRIVEDILTSRSWANAGGDFAPQLIATVLGRPVRIIQPSGIIVIDPRADLNTNPGNTIHSGAGMITLVYNGSTHYDSTRSTIGIINF